MTISSDQNNAQAIDDVLSEYWAMHLRAEDEQKRIRDEALPLQSDHQKRTHDLEELHRRREAIERDISSQEAMLRTVAASLGDLNLQADKARRKAEMHAGNVARIVKETGRPHPKGRFEEANRQTIAEQFTQAPFPSGQAPASPHAAAPPTVQQQEEPRPADGNQSGSFARLRGALSATNGARQ
ncbi:hypothetical protein ABT299_11705 [Spirillospora sp. NPDC000708]